MSLYVRVFTNFYTHRKTMRLRAILGEDAYWVPPRLWAYAAENQPDGNFSSYQDAELALLIGYQKDATSMLQALLQAGFIDVDRRIHDWDEHNGYHQGYADRARKAAIAKWEKERSKEKGEDKTGKEMTVQERKGKEASTASSMLVASPKHNGTADRSAEIAHALECVRVMEPRLNAMFKRHEKTRWDYPDESALAEISRRPECLSELGELEAFQKSEGRYFPQSLRRLLENWQETVDRARVKPSTTEPKHRVEKRAREYGEIIHAKRL